MDLHILVAALPGRAAKHVLVSRQARSGRPVRFVGASCEKVPHASRGCLLPSYNQHFLAMPKPEAFSRVLIDQELRESGWDLLDERRVCFELDGHSGRADYVLSGERGPLCVLEAKRPDLDPYEAKEQARGYAENLRAPSNRTIFTGPFG